VGLPPGRADQFLQGDTAWPFEQVQDLGRFASRRAVAACLARVAFRAGLALGRVVAAPCFAARAFLAGDPALTVGVVGASLVCSG